MENVALMHAVGATVGLSAGDSLLVFSTTAALSAAFAQNYGNDEEDFHSGGSSPKRLSGRRKPSSSDDDAADAEHAMVVKAAKEAGVQGVPQTEDELRAAKERRKVTERRQKAAFYRMERRLQDILTREFARFRFTNAVEGIKTAARRIADLAASYKGSGLTSAASMSASSG